MRTVVRSLIVFLVAELSTLGPVRAGGYIQTNLVANTPGTAQQTDPNLLNPWGMTYTSGGPFWIADEYSSMATVYTVSGTSSSPVQLTVPVNNLNGAAGPSLDYGPTGQVSPLGPGITVGSSDFLVGGTSGKQAAFIFDNLDGSIAAWAGTSPATIQTSILGASFTGLAIGNVGSTPFLFAADQNSPNVDVFNGKWQMSGNFTDPNGLPTGYTAFNVQNLGGTLFVTFVNPNNPVGGIVDEFTTSGAFIRRLIDDPTGNHLNTPWGMAIAPKGWGQFGGDLLIGNNSVDGWINAYSLDGTYQGHITLSNGQAFSEDELWALTFGNGGKAGSPDILYFADGGTDQKQGLFGALSAVPEPSSAVLCLIALAGLAGGRALRGRRGAIGL